MYPINLNNVPDDFELIDDKVPFDPKKHLQLEKPNEIYSLKDLGYSEEIIKNSPERKLRSYGLFFLIIGFLIIWYIKN